MKKLITAIILIMITTSANVYAYDTQEEIKKSASALDNLFEQSGEISDTKDKMRVILDVAGGVRILLNKMYNTDNVTVDIENEYQLVYSFALTKIGGLAEKMGLHRIASCHLSESRVLFELSQTDIDDASKLPVCRTSIYSHKLVSEIQQRMVNNKSADKKYNLLAGKLIKQISINSFYTVKSMK